MNREDRRAQLAIAGVIVVGVLLRLLVVRSPGFPSDVATFEAWAKRVAEVGPPNFYAPGYFSDYPPAYLYVLGVLGRFLDGEFLRLAVKAMSIPFDIAIAVIAATLVWRTAGRASAILAAALWMLAPGPIFAGPYWGQVDAVGTVPLMLALVMAGRGRWGWAGVLGALAAMIKPQFGVGLIVIGAAAATLWIRHADWRAPLRAIGAAAVTIAALGLPFRAGPGELLDLVRSASATYPYTSLYAFNIWSVVGDFWKPDDDFVVTGGALLVLGLIASCLMVWRRRDVPTLLAAGALATFAFYFLPTRAHERYLFPAFALLLPMATVRARLLFPYVALAVSFAASLFFAFTRYPQNDLRSPQFLEDTIFTRNGQVAIALLMMGLAAYLAWRLARSEATLEPDIDIVPAPSPPSDVATEGARFHLPKIFALGGPPSRRDIATAFLVALVVLVTRGYRLDQPRDMYFDEVYHARTAFELLAQREPYEWTHPHLAKEIMALGILAFGDDRVVGMEPALPNTSAFAVTNQGLRVSVSGGTLAVVDRSGQRRDIGLLGGDASALAVDGERVYTVAGGRLAQWSTTAGAPQSVQLPSGDVTSLVVSAQRVVVGTKQSILVYDAFPGTPRVVPRGVVALASRTDGSLIYGLSSDGVVHVIDPNLGQETTTLSGKGPGGAIAFAQAPDRIFIARTDTPALDVIDLDAHSTDTVPLANDRTGPFTSGATALAVIPRTQFLYALTPGKVVVVETHGASPFASIPVNTSARFLGIDGDDDKLLVAGPDAVERIETGRHALAWRIPGVVFAAILAFFLFLLARRLFASPVVAYFLAAIVVLDGSMYAQARIGMNDIYVTAFIVACWYFIVASYRPRRRWWVDILVAGILIGFGAAAKWAAIYTLAGIFVASVGVTAWAYLEGRPGGGGPLDLLRGRGRNAAFLFASFAVIPFAIYLGGYQRWFGGPTAPYGWNLWELTQQMYWYHSSLTSPHCAGSPWWAWPLDLKPVYWYFGQSNPSANAYIYDAGNPILFWAALPAAAIVCGIAVRARSVALGVVALAMLTQFVAWIPISRVLFFYHFFTVLPFYLLCLAIVLAALWDRKRNLVIGYGIVAAFAFLFFYPYVSAVPVPGELGSAYQILPTWQYDPAFSPTDSCPTPISANTATSLTVGIAWLYELAAAGLGVAVAIGYAPVMARVRRWGWSSDSD